MNGNDAVAIFFSGVVLVLGGAVVYILWDNSIRKFQEVSQKVDNCMVPLTERMLAMEKFLARHVHSEEDQRLFEEIQQCRIVYETRLKELNNCIKRP